MSVTCQVCGAEVERDVSLCPDCGRSLPSPESDERDESGVDRSGERVDRSGGHGEGGAARSSDRSAEDRSAEATAEGAATTERTATAGATGTARTSTAARAGFVALAGFLGFVFAILPVFLLTPSFPAFPSPRWVASAATSGGGLVLVGAAAVRAGNVTAEAHRGIAAFGGGLGLIGTVLIFVL